MKTLLAVCAALACVLATQAGDAPERPTFFKDVPGRKREDENNPESRIYNGGIATRTQFPFMAALYIDLSVFCGGSLINEEWVLTAAHCVDAGNIYYVYLGVTESMQPSQENRVTFVTRGGYYHPKYDSYDIINDVGVIQLPRKATINEYVQTVMLTPAHKQYVGYTATVSGFGKTDDGSTTQISDVLRYTTLPVVDNQVCSNAYGSVTGGDASVICLKADSSSSCSGDSGGPLTVTVGGQRIQIGTVSFGSSAGCSYGKPVGYGNIANLLDWIEQQTGIQF